MKKFRSSLLVAVILTAFSLSAFSQDVIILRSGDEIPSVVSEIGIDVIKYKKADNPEGPVYTIEKAKVFMIKYANGTKDVFDTQQAQTVTQPVTPAPVITEPTGPAYLVYKRGIRLGDRALSDSEVTALYAPYPDIMKHYKSGQALTILGDVCQWSVIGAGIVTALIMRPVDDLAQKNEIAKKGLITMGGLTLGWITFGVFGATQSSKSVDLYNAELKKQSSLKLDFYWRGNEAGLALRF